MNAITEAFVLPEDVAIVPVADLSERLRSTLDAPDGEFLISRAGARSGSRIVDEQAADLLLRFRSPTRIVDAVIAFSHDSGDDPASTLEDAFPMLQRLIDSGVLVAVDSGLDSAIGLSLRPGERFAGWEVVAPLQVLEDTELFQVRDDDGRFAALKLFVAAGRPHVRTLAAREAELLTELEGDPAPRLLAHGEQDGRPYLLLEWIAGVPANVAADELREDRAAIVALCQAVAEAYARLHARGVIHSDVHPGNVFVGPDGAVRLLDFGVARRPDEATRRAGIPFYLEPEYAQAVRAGTRPPQSSFKGEQYALAAMLYLLATGVHRCEFSLEQGELLRQIAEEPPLPFAAPWPQLEALLAKSLAHDPQDRLPDVATLAQRLGELVVEDAVRPVDLSHAHALLDRVLGRLGPQAALPAPPTSSVNYGAAGIGYALYRLAGLRDDPELLALADLWSTRALAQQAEADGWTCDELELSAEVVGPISAFHTAAGAWCVAALIAHARGDLFGRAQAIQGFVNASLAPCENLDLTLGRTSTLLACTLLLEAGGPEPALLALGERTLQGVWERLDGYGPIGEERELRYLGIAHGWAGILYATLRWRGGERPAALGERLDQLARLAEPRGRGLRWKVASGGADYMSGWCNGSAGHVHLWTLAAREDAAFGALAEGAGWDAWEADDPVGQICCGRAGRAYALLELYRHTGDARWLRRARTLADRAARHVSAAESEGREDSLYKGEVGIALLAAEQEAPERAAMPFFAPEGWVR